MATVGFSCTCGQVTGHIDVPSPAAGNHVVCHCPDCRVAALWAGQPDPAPDGVELWQTTPDKVHIETGADQLTIMQLSPKGLYRWHAACCKAPLFNTLRKPRLAFAGVIAARLDDTAPLGPLIGRAFMKQPDGKYRHEGFNRIGARIVKMMLAANLSGRWRQTPFFDADGNVTAPTQVISKEERAALTRS